MKIITQISLFDDTQNENLGDLERLRRVIEHMPDEKLIRKLEEIRGKGRNEWPVAAMWNSLLASFIFDHDSIASLIRELNRNSQLRMVCGFQPHFHTGKDGGAKLVLAPGASAYTNFINNLRKCRYFLADRGYDSTELIEWLEAENVSAVIDIRNMWKEESTKQFRDTDLIYSFNGKVYYVNEEGKQIELLYKGYDKSRNSSRYGFHPKYRDSRIFRIPLKTDRRVFTKVARNSKKWRCGAGSKG